MSERLIVANNNNVDTQYNRPNIQDSRRYSAENNRFSQSYSSSFLPVNINTNINNTLNSLKQSHINYQQSESFLNSRYMHPIPEESQSHSHSHSQSQSYLSRPDTPSSPNRNQVHQGNNNKNHDLIDRLCINRLLLVMTIDIGNGNQDTIHIYDDDNPLDLAKAFVLKHGLALTITALLAQNIHKNMEQAIKDRELYIARLYSKDNEYSNEVDHNYSISNMESNSQMLKGNTTLDRPSSNALNSSNTNIMTSSTPIPMPMSKHYDDNNNNNNTHTYSTCKQPPHACNTPGLSARNLKQRKRLNLSYDSSNQYSNGVNSIYHPLSSSTTTKAGKSPVLASAYNNIESYLKSKDDHHQKFINKKHNTEVIDIDMKKRILHPIENALDDRGDNKTIYTSSLISKDKDIDRNGSMNIKKVNKRSKSLVNSRPKTNIINEKTLNMSMNKTQAQKANKKLKDLNDYSSSPYHANTKTTTIIATNPNNVSTTNTTNTSQISGKTTAFDPLHKLSLLFCGLLDTTLSNYGTLLYNKGLKRQEELIKDRNDKKRELLEQEVKECTFKPAVNPISNEIIINKNRNEPPEEILIKFGKEIKNKLDRQRSIKTLQEIENCSFKPEINHDSNKVYHHLSFPFLINRSEKIVIEKQKGNTGDRCLKLFNDHKDKLNQQENKHKSSNIQEHNFTPLINSYSSKLVDQTTFEERNQKYIENLKKQKEHESIFESSTPKQLFKPKTGRAPYHRNRENLSIGDYLYNQRIEYENLKRGLIEKEQKTLEESIVRPTDRSQLLVEANKRKRLQAIFHCLDSDNDGLISSTKIDISTIETPILEILAPLLCEMEDLDKAYNESSFIEAVEKLLKALSIQEKALLLMGKRDISNKLEDECTFKPQINKKSKQIAENRRSQGGIIGLYDQGIEERRLLEEKLKQERENRIQEELKECSFRPLLITTAIANVNNSLLNFKLLLEGNESSMTGSKLI